MSRSLARRRSRSMLAGLGINAKHPLTWLLVGAAAAGAYYWWQKRKA